MTVPIAPVHGELLNWAELGVFTGFDTTPGWRDVLILHLIVTVVRLAESVGAPNSWKCRESVIENSA